MPDLPKGVPELADQYTAQDKLQEIEREIRIREKLYPQWIAAGRLEVNRARKQIEVLRAVARDYRERSLL